MHRNIFHVENNTWKVFLSKRIEAQREPSMPFGKSAAVTNQGREARSLGPPPPRFSVPSACPGPSWPQGSSRRCPGEQKPWHPSPPAPSPLFLQVAPCAPEDVFVSPLPHPRTPPFRGSLLSSLSHSSEPFSQLQKVY